VLDLRARIKAAIYAYFVVNLLMLPSPHVCPYEDEYINILLSQQHIADIGRGSRFFQELLNRGDSARGDLSKAHVGRSVGDKSQDYHPIAPSVGS
jgi:hypothetical protein